MGKAIEITDHNFEAIVMGSDKPVLVDFWAAWCGPCLMIAPHIEKLAIEYEGKAVIGKLDVDANPRIARQFGIRSIPTLLFFKDKEIVEKQIGGATKDALAAKLDGVLQGKKSQ